jgi:hypothetical protein
VGSEHLAITIQAVDLHSKKAIEQFLHLPWTIYESIKKLGVTHQSGVE